MASPMLQDAHAALNHAQKAAIVEDRAVADAETAARGGFGITGVLAWVAVGIPFLIGLYIALKKAAALL